MATAGVAKPGSPKWGSLPEMRTSVVDILPWKRHASTTAIAGKSNTS